MKRLVFLLMAIGFTGHTNSAITKSELYSLFNSAHSVYDHTLEENEQITFNPGQTWWDFDVWKAAYSPYTIDGIHYHGIYLFGGLARAEFMSIELATLMICHELGHAFAGAPLKVNGNAVEGQADYYSTGFCLKSILSYHPITSERLDQIKKTVAPEILYWCHSTSCIRGLYAIYGQMEFFRQHEMIQTDSSFFEHDPTVVTKIDHSLRYYPSVQCRVDTYISGLFQHPKPRCWFIKEDNNKIIVKHNKENL